MPTTTKIRFPKLRPVDPSPLIQDGQAFFLLRDPLELSEETLLVPQALGPVLALCDGSREDADAIAAALIGYFGVRIDTQVIDYLLSALDQVLLLENERSAEALARIADRFRAAPFRTPLLAGPSYPAQPTELRQMLDSYLERAAIARNGNHPGTIRGLLSPHIDYPRGGPVYASAWQRAAEMAQEADLVVVFATDHYGDDPVTLTRQNYATPFGVLPTEQTVVDAVAAALGEDAVFAGELRHRNEHSIELVSVWLHHMRQGKPVDLVPILVGPYTRFADETGEPDGHPLAERLLESLRLATRGRNLVVVASGDMSHVGPAFGGEPLDAEGKADIRSFDETLIRHMVAGDADGLFRAIFQANDRTNVCGTTPIYLAMRLLGRTRGQLTSYQQCPADKKNTSIVSVSGVAFE
jgi:hypothetical protein